MSILVGRHIGGITLNPLEFILDSDTGLPREFKSEQQAVILLEEAGFSSEQIESFTFVNKESWNENL